MIASKLFIAVIAIIVLQCGCHISSLYAEVHDLQVADVHTSPNSGESHGVREKRHNSWTTVSKSKLPPFDRNDLNSTISFARETVSRMARFEANLEGADVTVRRGTPAQGQLIDSYPGAQAVQQGKEAVIAVKASIFLAHRHCRRFGYKEAYCAKFVTNMNMSATSLGDKCLAPLGKVPFCSARYKYRSFNGSCNHQTQPSAGQALTSYRRLLPAAYGDSFHDPRENFKGKALPSARLISTVLARDGNKIDEDKTLALMQWGQFVEHDMSHTPVSKMSTTASPIICCQPDGTHLKPRHLHPSCMPVTVPENDPFFARYRVKCMNYVRSTPAIRSDCSFGPQEQMNQVTHYVDGSMIYGTTEHEAHSLREHVGGLLLEDPENRKGLLPLASQPTSECQVESVTSTCYRSGDIRVNAQPHLTVMHILWHREHNRIAHQLARLNPSWSDESLYQETRRIVVAEIQHITYTEWLPAVIGKTYMESLGINPSSEHIGTFFEDVDPSVSNSFATAAMRFVQSMMDSRLRLYDEQRRDTDNLTLNLKDHFNRPKVVDQLGHLDALIRGLATQSSQKSDMEYVKDMTNLLYQESGPYGLDVISLDIQRGRDHGLPGYNHYREQCDLPRATSFSQFTDAIPRELVKTLEELYSHPDDVDLLIGGMSERPMEGGILGHTFRCILGEQFSRTRTADRFFYDLRRGPHSFTPNQLREIKKTTLARIFCDNGDNIRGMQPDVFKKPSKGNPLVSCKDESHIPRLNLNPWAEAMI